MNTISIETLKTQLVNWAPKAITALAVLLIGYIIARLATGLFRKVLKKGKLDQTLVGFLGNLLYMILMTLVVIMAIGRLGVDTTSFAAVLAAAGLAVGFALQDSLGNFASGVMLIAFRPFKSGDLIQAGGVTGVVDEINVFSTRIKSLDNQLIIVPNGQITSAAIVNMTAEPIRRVDMVFGIGYDDDIRQAKSILEEILASHPKVLKEPESTVAVSELADSSVNFVVRPWCDTADYWTVWFDVHESVKTRFDSEGISIPYPQRDVHVYSNEAQES